MRLLIENMQIHEKAWVEFDAYSDKNTSLRFIIEVCDTSIPAVDVYMLEAISKYTLCSHEQPFAYSQTVQREVDNILDGLEKNKLEICNCIWSEVSNIRVHEDASAESIVCCTNDLSLRLFFPSIVRLS